MLLPLNTQKNNFHRRILEIIRNLPPLNKLSSKELDLLAILMKQQIEYSYLVADQRKLIIFSAENKTKLAQEINCTRNSLNIYLSKFTKLKILNHNKELIPLLQIPYGDFSITFKLTINEANTQN